MGLKGINQPVLFDWHNLGQCNRIPTFSTISCIIEAKSLGCDVVFLTSDLRKINFVRYFQC